MWSPASHINGALGTGIRSGQIQVEELNFSSLPQIQKKPNSFRRFTFIFMLLENYYGNIMENYVISLHILLLLGWNVLKEIGRAHLKTAGWGHWSDWRVFPGFYLAQTRYNQKRSICTDSHWLRMCPDYPCPSPWTAKSIHQIPS